MGRKPAVAQKSLANPRRRGLAKGKGKSLGIDANVAGDSGTGWVLRTAEKRVKMEVGWREGAVIYLTTIIAHAPWLAWHWAGLVADFDRLTGGDKVGTTELGFGAEESRRRVATLALHMALGVSVIQSGIDLSIRPRPSEQSEEANGFVSMAVNEALESGGSVVTTRNICAAVERIVRIMCVAVAINLPSCVKGAVLCQPWDLLGVLLAFRTVSCWIVGRGSLQPLPSLIALVAVATMSFYGSTNNLTERRLLFEYVASLFLGTVVLQSAAHGLLDRSDTLLQLVQHVRTAWDTQFFRDADSFVFSVNTFFTSLKIKQLAVLTISLIAALLLLTIELWVARSVAVSTDPLTKASSMLLAAEEGLGPYLVRPLVNTGLPNFVHVDGIRHTDRSDEAVEQFALGAVQLESVAAQPTGLSLRQNSTFCTLKAAVLFLGQHYEPALACLGCASAGSEASASTDECFSLPLLSLEKGARYTALKPMVSIARNQMAKNRTSPVLASDQLGDAVNTVKAAKYSLKARLKWATLARDTCRDAKRATHGTRKATTLLRIAQIAHFSLVKLGFAKMALWCEDVIVTVMNDTAEVSGIFSNKTTLSSVARTDAKEAAIALFDQAVYKEHNLDLYEDVLVALEAATAEYPFFGDAWYKLGFIRAALSDSAAADDAALEAFQIARDLDPLNHELLQEQGVLLTRMGRFDEAKNNLRIALERARVAFKKKGSSVSLAYLMRLRSDLCHAHLSAGESHATIRCATRREGDPNEYFSEAHAPVNIFTHRGIAKARIGDMDGTRDDFLSALQHSEWLLLQTKKVSDGKPHINGNHPDRACYSVQAHADAHNNIGSFMFNNADLNGAKRHFSSALTLLPGHQSALSNLELLTERTSSLPNA